ncbi:tRNA:m(5)U-54 methyltransferase [Candidatus Magnetoovum chiemensis]|nr:tRNA:m(5)U-54 methyltransferase [Candidatus Magnetoovum chiemensis]
MQSVEVIGGGLAGSEAAYQLIKRGIAVKLYEMRPHKLTPAHKSGYLGELVCSNSLRSTDLTTGHGILKEELQMADSLIMEAARHTQVPAGNCLAVDREAFAQYITKRLEASNLIEIIRQEVTELPKENIAIIATGPLTSNTLAQRLQTIIKDEHLFFYDALAPIIDSDTIDYEKAFFASRYDKGGDDYLNCPMDKNEYDKFYDALLKADSVSARDFEQNKVFEGCMPIEIMAQRGRDTLRFGPLKPVGLLLPKTKRQAYAVVQLRAENAAKTSYNMVGCQTRLKYGHQEQVFRLIPGLEKAEFLRFGSIHRNTYINSPLYLNKDLSFKSQNNLYLAGQITAVEGYLESTAIGLLAGIFISHRLKGFLSSPVVPSTTAHGALINYITTERPIQIEPSNINIGLFPPLEEKIKDKKQKRAAISKRALYDWKHYLKEALS